MSKYQSKDILSQDTSVAKNTGFIECLRDNHVVIYGTHTCPACKSLLEKYLGYGDINLIYTNCSSGDEADMEKCMSEMQTSYVPEIQIDGVLLEQQGLPEVLAEITGCPL